MRHRILIAAALALGLAGCAVSVDQQGQDTVARLRTITDADLAQAQRLATINKDDAALQCLAAIQTIVIEVRTWTAVGPMTLFQAGMDVTNPGGFLNVACAAERANVKARVNLFIGSTATLLAAFGL